jgi:hypothetical protein
MQRIGWSGGLEWVKRWVLIVKSGIVRVVSTPLIKGMPRNQLKRRMTVRILSFDIGIKNLGYAVLSIQDGDDKRIGIHQVGSMNIEPKKTTKKDKASLEFLCEELYNQLSAFHDALGPVDYVLLENQPVMKNPIMKSIQMLLYGFYGYLKHCSGDGSGWSSCGIRLIRATGKLTLANELGVELPPTKSKSAYRKNKLLGIACGEHLVKTLETDECVHVAMMDKKKRDDMCDSLCQGVYFATKTMGAAIPTSNSNQPNPTPTNSTKAELILLCKSRGVNVPRRATKKTLLEMLRT